MSLKKKVKAKTKNAPTVADVASAEVAQPTVVPSPSPVESMITFNMYCVRKGIKERHRAGMAVWAKSKKVVRATFSEWEAVFEGY